ncbi:hypothetical protein [Nocardia pseudobrasiliensis]|uniref:Uncharacterized protein n=1 Tax=Nocardia pseudobrasiliensis TaxID=45979 RepID=A0A370I4F4_9NOCA|nr:hypothetical protein [Nocardia pseudobrasiliensis]RDI65608.1 hypothetical protein DFR76_106480 [Nocardia pseudobrasiliensis]
MAEELSTTPSEGFEAVGRVEMRSSPLGAGDIHGLIDEIARAAAGIGGEYFFVTDSLGATITADVYRRSTGRPRRGAGLPRIRRLGDPA